MSELKFSSYEEATQYLANLTGKLIKVAFNPSFKPKVVVDLLLTGISVDVLLDKIEKGIDAEKVAEEIEKRKDQFNEKFYNEVIEKLNKIK